VTGRTALHETAAPGANSHQCACPVCFARVLDADSSLPGVVMMCAGTLDRGDELEIAAHI
jgi:hypothetical protein